MIGLAGAVIAGLVTITTARIQDRTAQRREAAEGRREDRAHSLARSGAHLDARREAYGAFLAAVEAFRRLYAHDRIDRDHGRLRRVDPLRRFDKEMREARRAREQVLLLAVPSVVEAANAAYTACLDAAAAFQDETIPPGRAKGDLVQDAYFEFASRANEDLRLPD